MEIRNTRNHKNNCTHFAPAFLRHAQNFKKRAIVREIPNHKRTAEEPLLWVRLHMCPHDRHRTTVPRGLTSDKVTTWRGSKVEIRSGRQGITCSVGHVIYDSRCFSHPLYESRAGKNVGTWLLRYGLDDSEGSQRWRTIRYLRRKWACDNLRDTDEQKNNAN